MKNRVAAWKILFPLLLGIVVMTAAFIRITYSAFREYEIHDCVSYAKGLTWLIKDEILDPNKVNEYVEKGRKTPGYGEVEQRLYHLRKAYPEVKFLYVYQIREDGCHVVFDLDTEDFKASEPGDVEPFEYFPSFHQYIPDLLAGKEIPPVESQEEYGHLLTVYTPVYDRDGECVCYIGADYSMEGLREYTFSVIRQILLFFLIVLAVIIGATVIATAFGMKKLHKLEDNAYFDTLTGLQNRTAFYERTGEMNKKIAAAGGKGDFSAMMIDVNFLKKMNDVYGHEQGNIYLQGAGDLMKKIFGDRNLYRIGGDEFAILLEGKDQEGAAEKIASFKEEIAARKADESLQPWEKISAAVGIARFMEGEETMVEETIRRADEAMYQDKVAMKAERKD